MQFISQNLFNRKVFVIEGNVVFVAFQPPSNSNEKQISNQSNKLYSDKVKSLRYDEIFFQSPNLFNSMKPSIPRFCERSIKITTYVDDEELLLTHFGAIAFSLLVSFVFKYNAEYSF